MQFKGSILVGWWWSHGEIVRRMGSGQRNGKRKEVGGRLMLNANGLSFFSVRSNICISPPDNY